MGEKEEGLYIVLISVHGLMRAESPELGRDADTGGQILYVLELARELARHPNVERVDVLTRRVIDGKVDEIYQQPFEELAPGANIVRLECGPKRYLRKEVLWPHLNQFIDKALLHLRELGQVPDVIHSHYADAGMVASRMASLLGVTHVHTGHSLGRVKKKQLLAKGSEEETIERRYNISQRIEAEEMTLDTASLVVASTSQEVEEQYALYDNYHPQRMRVLPPGVDLSRFMPPAHYDPQPEYYSQIQRFLAEPRKPMILAMSRADERKNIRSLVQAYGESESLRELANLVLIMGNREKIADLDRGARNVLNEVILMIDEYDLHGKVAYPKHHGSNEVPDIYRIAAKSRGVFVNPALTEPFGLTLIEASATGLPIVSTHDGGPRDIIAHCKNGILVDPLDIAGIQQALLHVLSDKRQWKKWSNAGIKGTRTYYSWSGHVENYLKELSKIHKGKHHRRHMAEKNRLPTVDRLAIASIDNCLIGDRQALKKLLVALNKARNLKIGFGIATGRSLDSTLKELKQWDIPMPDIIISSVGTEIYYPHHGRHMAADHSWEKHIDHRWDADEISKVLKKIPGLRKRGKQEQSRFKISYFVNPSTAPPIPEIKKLLRTKDLHCNLIYSNEVNLDVVPIRAAKGLALRYVSLKWGIPLESVFVAGDSGNDIGMLQGETLATVVANHSVELDKYHGKYRIYFAEQEYALGVLEGLEHYNFLNNNIDYTALDSYEEE
ncbi:MAG: HAD-IIB family hydrolase [Gammaproteobacteria bacterium]|nr:HAD-IIB family hydrolase [Gammaproteobacteria bacterium]